MAMIWSHFSGREILDRRDELDAGVVDQDVDRTEGLFGVRDHGGDLGGLGHVGAVINRLDAKFLFDAAALRLDRGGVAEAVDQDIAAFLGEGAGDGEADARSRAGDDGGFGGERHDDSP